MTLMSCTLLRWLAGRLSKAAGQMVANWMLDTCNTEPPVQSPGHEHHASIAIRFAMRR